MKRRLKQGEGSICLCSRGVKENGVDIFDENPKISQSDRIEFFRHVVDASLNRILKITPDGDFSRIAGTDIAGFSGDGGPAIEARLTFPDDLVIDRNGNIFFSDSGNAVIRKIATNGIITTFAEVIVPFGLALDPEGNIFVADGGGHQIIKISPIGEKVVFAGTGIPGSSGDGGAAIGAELNTPFGILVDSEDNLLIADSRNNRIRKIDMATGNISTFAGVGTPSLAGPSGPIGDGGPASESAIGRPTYLASDAAGNLFISQDESPLSINSRLIRQIDVNGIISTFFGKGGDGFLGTTGRRPASEARLNDPQALARDASGNLYYIDFNNHVIHKLDITRNEVFIIAGDIFLNPGFSGDGGPATKAQLNFPRGIVLDKNGNLFIADTRNHRVRKVGTDGKIFRLLDMLVHGSSIFITQPHVVVESHVVD